jgi:hypothetical protein
MKKLALLIGLLPLNAMAHPGHVEMTLTTLLGFIFFSVTGAFAMHRVLSFAREKRKR